MSDQFLRELHEEVTHKNLWFELESRLEVSRPPVTVANPLEAANLDKEQEVLDHERAIRKIFSKTRRGKRRASRPYCEKMDATSGIETKRSWQNRAGAACPRSYVGAWDYPADPDIRRSFRDLICHEVARIFPRH